MNCKDNRCNDKQVRPSFVEPDNSWAIKSRSNDKVQASVFH